LSATGATPRRPAGSARRAAIAAAIALVGLTIAAPVVAADMQWKTIRIGTRSLDSPEGVAESAAAIGFETDLARDLCIRMAAVCEIQSGKGDETVAALQARRVDALMAWLPVTGAGRQAIDFSYVYAVERHGLVVPNPGPLAELPGTGKVLSLAATPQDARDAIASLRARLAGRTVGALAGSADLAFLQAQLASGVTIRPYATAEAEMRDLAEGRLDAVMGSVAWLRAALALPEYRGLAMSGPQFGEDDLFGYGIAVGLRKSDPALRDMFDRAISKAMSDGTLERLSLKWFKVDISPHRCSCKPF
jgi:octopine/nopaline transport system substrate-binding protein